MKQMMIMLALFACTLAGFSQYERERDEDALKGGVENIFVGGSVSLSFGNRSFLVGGNPMIGYKIAEWVDAGLAFNYQYSSFRDYNFFGDKLRQSIYGGGVFTRLFPVNFLFAQAQFEHNFIYLRYIPPPNSGSSEKRSTSENSFLVGAGYTQGRFPGVNNTFFYLTVLFDISDNINSPYTNVFGKPTPIFRAGINAFPFRR